MEEKDKRNICWWAGPGLPQVFFLPEPRDIEKKTHFTLKLNPWLGSRQSQWERQKFLDANQWQKLRSHLIFFYIATFFWASGCTLGIGQAPTTPL